MEGATCRQYYTNGSVFILLTAFIETGEEAVPNKVRIEFDHFHELTSEHINKKARTEHHENYTLIPELTLKF